MVVKDLILSIMTVELSVIENNLPGKEDCTYTPYYCEENIWMLAKKIEETNNEKLNCCFPVFISNNSNFVPLWRQTIGDQESGFVAWDYHVIMVYLDSYNALVYDFDTRLPFPCSFSTYCKETFRPDETLAPEHERFFRLISAELYLKYFSSDRRHMIRKNGSWLKPPPDYPIIQNQQESHNLAQYISMKVYKPQDSKFGNVLHLQSFIDRFTINDR